MLKKILRNDREFRNKTFENDIYSILNIQLPTSEFLFRKFIYCKAFHFTFKWA